MLILAYLWVVGWLDAQMDECIEDIYDACVCMRVCRSTIYKSIVLSCCSPALSSSIVVLILTPIGLTHRQSCRDIGNSAHVHDDSTHLHTNMHMHTGGGAPDRSGRGRCGCASGEVRAAIEDV